MATWPSGQAEACKALYSGSNPDVALNFICRNFFQLPKQLSRQSSGLKIHVSVVRFRPWASFLPLLPHIKDANLANQKIYIALAKDAPPPIFFLRYIKKINLVTQKIPLPYAKNVNLSTLKPSLLYAKNANLLTLKITLQHAVLANYKTSLALVKNVNSPTPIFYWRPS